MFSIAKISSVATKMLLNVNIIVLAYQVSRSYEAGGLRAADAVRKKFINESKR